MTTLIKVLFVWCCAMIPSKASPDLRPFAATDENSRKGMAEKVADGKILQNHVIAKYLLRNDFECLHKCVATMNCKSFNFEQSAGAGNMKLCWLNSETRKTKPLDFIDMTSFAYFGWEKGNINAYSFEKCKAELRKAGEPACAVTHCKNGGTCTKGDQYSPYRCTCPYGYTGMHCETYRGYDVKFTNTSGKESLALRLPKTLASFTICFWIQPLATERPNATVVSYIRVKPFAVFLALTIYRKHGDIELMINEEIRRHKNLSLTDDIWHQLCTSWESKSGNYKFFQDGSVTAQGSSFQKGTSLEQNGLFVIGECPRNSSGCFPAFQGQITSVTVWSTVLTDRYISQLTQRPLCEITTGDVVSWSMFHSGEKRFDSVSALTTRTNCKTPVGS